MRSGAATCDVERFSQQSEYHQHGYQPEDNARFFLLCEVEFQATGSHNPATNCRCYKYYEKQNGQNVQIKGECFESCLGQYFGRKRMPKRVSEYEQDIAQGER